MKFSERMGYIKKRIQIEVVDTDLRTQLWNFIILNLERLSLIEKGQKLKKIWCDQLVKPYDDFPTEPPKPDDADFVISQRDYRLYRNQPLLYYYDKLLPPYERKLKAIQSLIQKHFLNCKWFLVFDLLEFYVKEIIFEDVLQQEAFIEDINNILEKGVSAYRFVGTEISPIIDDIEIKEIEKALTNPLTAVKEHIKQALSLLSDRQQPDFRNSIKESISAVESLCRKISNNPNATLGDALKLVEKNKDIELHPAQKEAFSKLYGWTSDKKSGIRHGMMDISKLGSEDARFMLIACSAFINYLVEKAIKAGIKFETL